MLMRKGLVFVLVLVGLSSLGYAITSSSFSEQEPPKGHLIYTGSMHYPPLEWTNNDGLPQGFIQDLLQAIAHSAEHTTEVRLQLWSDALEAVREQQADVIALIPSEERAAYYDFTKPFHYVAHGIFSHVDGIQYGSLEQLEQKRVAVVQGAFAERELQQLNIAIDTVAVESELACMEWVAQKRVDACVEVIVTSNHLAQMHQLPISVSSPPFWPKPYVFAVRKGNDETLELLNSRLAQIIVDGSYKEIYQRWAGELEWYPASLWSQLKKVIWLIIAVTSIIMLSLAWSYSLNRRVKLRTFELSQELRHSEQLKTELAYQAKHDSVTGLYNRDAFLEALQSKLSRKSKGKQPGITVVAMQTSNLEDIVTVFGYSSALETLRCARTRLAELDKVIVAHIGFGNFLLATPSLEYAIEAIEFLLIPRQSAHSIEPQFLFGVTESFTTPDKPTKSADELIRNAITALNVAKRNHCTWRLYSSEMDPDSRNLKLINDFRLAGCKNFELHYQPQLSLTDNRVSHAEALVRWRHPTFGLLSPYQFVPILEDSGYIGELTRWVVTEALAMSERCQLRERGITLSVNVATSDLVDSQFIAFLQSQAKHYPLDNLILEVTESAVLDKGKALENMRTLNQLGINFAIDDYGTGYSTLSYLADLVAHEIKIDRSLIINILTENRNEKIIRSTIALAKELNLMVVAEGVENLNIVHMLRDMNCDRIQGYIVAKPMEEQEVANLLGAVLLLP